MTDRDALAAVARAILDGTPVDWEAVDATPDDARRAVVHELRLVADIARLHRALNPPRDLPPASPAATRDPSTPEALGRWGHLTLLEQVGQGAFGEVYRAWDERLEREVALKLLHVDATPDGHISTVLGEARRLARVQHPHVVSVYDADTIDGRAGIWMEFVRGQTLEQWVRERDPVAPAEAMTIGLMLCRALSAVHRAGLLHRDLTARNVVREEGGRVVLMDFGTGRRLAPPDAQITDVGGTPLYMAPEVLAGQAASVQSDLYSLGVLLYYLVTRIFPVAGRTLDEVNEAHRQRARTRLHAVRADVPAAFVRVIDRATAPEPAARFASAEALEAALARSVPRDARAPSTRRRPLDPPPVARPRRRTVGRQRELMQLRAAFDSVAAGQGRLFCVTGEPGIGKTTLVEEFLNDRLAGARVRVARGRCSERLAGTQAYLPFLDALAGLIQGGGGRSLASLMKRVAPLWHAIVGPARGDPASRAPEPPVERASSTHERMFFELGTFLRRVADDRPLVLFFDDLHWGDPSTIDLIAHLASRFDTARILILAAYRPTDPTPARLPIASLLLDLQARDRCTVLPLELLTLADTAQYVNAEFRGHRFPPAFPELIYAQTEGSPLFMVDLLRSLRDRGVIVRDGPGWVLAQQLPDIARALPDSIRSMIDRQLAQLDDADRQVLTLASVQGQEFDAAVVARAAGRDAVDVEDRLDLLARHSGLIRMLGERALAGRTFTLRCRFVHVLYQQALFGSLPPTRRASASGAVAGSLIECYGERSREVASELAFLFESAREPLRAAEQCRIAAEHATRIVAYSEAVALARRGLALLEQVPESPGRTRLDLALHVALGIPLWASKGFGTEEVEQSYSRARDLIASGDQDHELARALSGLVLVQGSRGDLKGAADVARQLLRLAEQMQDSVALADAHHMVGIVAMHAGAPVMGLRHFDAAVGLYDPAEHASYFARYGRDSGVSAAAFGAWCLWALGYPDQALRRSHESLTAAQRLDDPFTLGLAIASTVTLHEMRREAEATRAYAETLVDHASRHGLLAFGQWGAMWHGWALAELGHATEGLEEIHRTLSSESIRGHELIHPHAFALKAEACRHASRTEEGLASVTQGMAILERMGPYAYEPELYRLKGELLLASTQAAGAVDDAEACFRRAIAIAQQHQSRMLELRALTSLARHTASPSLRSETRRMLRDLCGTFTEGFDTPDLLDARSLLDDLP